MDNLVRVEGESAVVLAPADHPSGRSQPLDNHDQGLGSSVKRGANFVTGFELPFQAFTLAPGMSLVIQA